MSEAEVRAFIKDVKVALMMYSPFFYFLLNDMEVVYVDEISEIIGEDGTVIAKTPLAVMGTKLYVYKNAMQEGVVKKHPISTIKHELFHIALCHCIRGADIIRYSMGKHNLVPTDENIEKIRFLVNLAMDAKDNYLLKLDGDDVSWGFTGRDMWSEEEIEKCSVEELVEKIFTNPPQRVGGFGAGIDILQFGDGDGQGGTTIQEGDPSLKGLGGKELEDKLQQKVIESICKSKMAGVERGQAIRKLEDDLLLPRQQPWWLRLRYLMRSQTFKSKVTDWRIVNRKLPNQIAGLRNIKKPRCACLVDVSGSIGADEYRLFMAEMLMASKEADVTGIYWDAGIQEVRAIRSKQDVLKQVRGGGGTVFAPVLRNTDFSKYDVMVCLTDSEWYDNDEATLVLNKIHNVYKILCTTGREVAGFDELVKIDMGVAKHNF